MIVQKKQNALKAVVLLSGGLDSAVALGMVRQTHEVVLALTFDYGQRNARQEMDAAKAIATWASVPHQTIGLPWLAALLPEGMRAQPTDNQPVDRETLSAVWVPNRNGVLLNIAAAYAEKMDATAVVFGANADEGVAFPDNTPDFRQAINDALSFSTRNQVTVLAPLEYLTKSQIWQVGLKMGLPLQQTWSCYDSLPQPCGACLSCQHRQNAEKNG